MGTRLEGQEIIIGSFNQPGAIPGEPTPNVVYRGTGQPAEVEKAVNGIILPRRPNGAFADTDFSGALSGCLSTVVNRRPAVIWLVTNNKNDPNNSPDVISHTNAFYRLLRHDSSISRVVAYPVAMPTQGRHFREGGLMIYGIAYGKGADGILQQVLEKESIRKLFTKPPARLKPLDEQAVWFEPISVLTSGVSASLERGTLVIRGIEAEKGARIIIRGRLFNNFYPHVIKSASLSLNWDNLRGTGTTPGLPNEIQPTSLKELPPGGAINDVRVTIGIPPISTVWSADAIFKDGYEVFGGLRIGMTGQRLELDPSFQKHMDHVFGLGQLPEIFRPDPTIQNSNTLLPVRLVVRYPLWPLVLTIGGTLFLLSGIIAFVVVTVRERKYKVDVDGEVVIIPIKPFAVKPVVLPRDGRKVAELRGALLGKPGVKILDKAVHVRMV
jgi:hypothetical protein